MHIAICDDNPLDANLLHSKIEEYAKANSLPVNVFSFRSGDEFFDSDILDTIDIVFLDIYMEGTNGLKIAKKLRANYNHHIIFITNSKDHALEAFGVSAIHYIVKPASYKDVHDALSRCLSLGRQKEVYPLEIKIGHNTLYISPDKIQYIEAFNKLSVIHTCNEVYETYTTLSTLSGLLDKSVFFRPHRSYIVNMNYIDQIQTNELLLLNGTVITLSRINRKRLKDQYEQFIFKCVREGKI